MHTEILSKERQGVSTRRHQVGKEFTGSKVFVRGMKQILPRGGGAYATGTGIGTFSSGTGFLGTAGTLKHGPLSELQCYFTEAQHQTQTHTYDAHISQNSQNHHLPWNIKS